MCSSDLEENRTRLQAVAYRMLGSATEADDAVQESWLRLSRSDRSSVENLGGWLTTVIARVCLDMLRSRDGDFDALLAVLDPDVVFRYDCTAVPAGASREVRCTTSEERTSPSVISLAFPEQRNLAFSVNGRITFRILTHIFSRISRIEGHKWHTLTHIFSLHFLPSLTNNHILPFIVFCRLEK